MAFALPRINLIHSDPENRPGKQSAFAATWEASDMPGTVQANDMANGIRLAMSINPEQLRQIAEELAELYLQGFNGIHAQLQ